MELQWKRASSLPTSSSSSSAAASSLRSRGGECHVFLHKDLGLESAFASTTSTASTESESESESMLSLSSLPSESKLGRARLRRLERLGPSQVVLLEEGGEAEDRERKRPLMRWDLDLVGVGALSVVDVVERCEFREKKEARRSFLEEEEAVDFCDDDRIKDCRARATMGS